MDFQNFQNSNFDRGKFFKILSFINLPWDQDLLDPQKYADPRIRIQDQNINQKLQQKILLLKPKSEL